MTYLNQFWGKNTNFTSLWLGVLALGIIALHTIPAMSEYSMWYDEALVINEALHFDPSHFYNQDEMTPATFTHPPLYFLLIKIWSVFAGNRDVVFRAFSTWAMLIACAFVYRLAVDITHKPLAGLGAALFLGMIPVVKYYSHTNHNYTLYLCFASLLVWVYWRWSRSTPYSYWLAGILFATIALQYTHYYGAFLILAVNAHAFLTLSWPRKRIWLGIQALAFFFISPWAWVVYGLSKKDWFEDPMVDAVYHNDLNGLRQLYTELFYGVDYFLLGIILVGVIFLVWRRSQIKLTGITTLAMLIVFGTLIGFIINQYIPTLEFRRMMFLTALVAALAGIMFGQIPRLAQGAVIVGFLALTWRADFLLPGNWFFRQGVEYVAENADTETDTVLFYFTWLLEEYPFRYYSENLLPDSLPAYMQMDGPVYFEHAAWARDRLWVVWDGPFVMTPLLEKRGYTLQETTPIGWFNVSLYTAEPLTRLPMPDAPEIEKITLPQTFDGHFQLIDYQIDKITAAPNDTITVWLDWTAIKRTGENFGVYVHIIEDDFVTLHGQLDGAPSHMGRELPSSWWELNSVVHDAYTVQIAPDTPPGEYNLKIGMYSYLYPYRLPPAPGDGLNSDGVVIARITVE